MLNLRYFFRLAIAFINRFKIIILAGILLGVIGFFLISVLLPSIFRKDVITGLNGRYHTDTLPLFIQSMISGGLTRLNESGTPEPNLASSWETPDKGKTWIFHLKDNIYWQDSQPVTSQTIIYEFSDVQIEHPDDKTIIFKLQNAFSPFPVVVSRPTFRKGLLGTGEWKVKKISLAGSYVHQLTLVNTKKEKRIYKFYPTEERTKLAYKLGQIDQTINLIDPTPFLDWKTAKVIQNLNLDQIVTIFFNTQDKLFSEKSFRQALIYALNDKIWIGERRTSSISPNSWAYNRQSKQYSYDPQRALELIKELPKELRDNLNIKLVSTPVLLTIAESIAKDWEKIGVKTTVQVSSILPTEFQAYLAIFDIPKDPDQYSFWHSTQEVTNISNYTNPRIDKLLEDGRIELDFNERRKIYLDFQRFLSEDLPAGFLFHPTYYTISRE